MRRPRSKAPAASAARIEAEAVAALRAAREHKRMAGVHRRAARDEMQRFEALRARLGAFGVELVINESGAIAHGSTDTERTRRAG